MKTHIRPGILISTAFPTHMPIHTQYGSCEKCLEFFHKFICLQDSRKRTTPVLCRCRLWFNLRIDANNFILVNVVCIVDLVHKDGGEMLLGTPDLRQAYAMPFPTFTPSPYLMSNELKIKRHKAQGHGPTCNALQMFLNYLFNTVSKMFDDKPINPTGEVSLYFLTHCCFPSEQNKCP